MRRPAASMTRWSALVAPWGRGPSQIIPSVVKVPLRFALTCSISGSWLPGTNTTGASTQEATYST